MGLKYAITRRDFLIYGATLASSGPTNVVAHEPSGFEKLRRLATRIEQEVTWFRILEDNPDPEKEQTLKVLYEGNIKGKRVKLEIRVGEIDGFDLIMRKGYGVSGNQKLQKRTWDSGPGSHVYIDGYFDGNLMGEYDGVDIKHDGTGEEVIINNPWYELRLGVDKQDCGGVGGIGLPVPCTGGWARLDFETGRIEIADGYYSGKTFDQLMKIFLDERRRADKDYRETLDDVIMEMEASGQLR